MAQADASLDRGVRLAADAEFEGALEVLDQAEAASLSRRERVELYATRALVTFALGDAARARADLARLLALGADASLPRSAPPQLWEILEELRRAGVRPTRVLTEARIEHGVARIDARAEGGADLTREVRVWVEGEARGARVERPLGPGESLEWYAEALGPSAIVLATNGTEAAPNVLRVRVLEGDANVSSDEETAWWIALGGGGGALLVGAAVTLGVVLSAGGEGTQLTGPTLER